MCVTCGCSDGETRVTDLASADHHHDENLPGHTHDHAHPIPHDQGHGHSHEPAGPGHAHGAIEADPTTRTLVLEQAVLAKNNRLAEANRAWLGQRGILAVNLMSSPGSGKTTLLERTVRDLGGEFRLSVVEGDQETLLDAERIRATGAGVVQVNTGSGCHLDADMLARSLAVLDPSPGSIVIIENVGNLVCPALFDLGERAKVVIMSTTEGADKPLKYPQMFRAADLMVVNKIDLLPYVDFDVAVCTRYARQINPRLDVVEVSARSGEGLERWYDWLRQQSARSPEPPA